MKFVDVLSFNGSFAARSSPDRKNSDTKSGEGICLDCCVLARSNDCVIRTAVITINIKMHPATLFGGIAFLLFPFPVGIVY